MAGLLLEAKRNDASKQADDAARQAADAARQADDAARQAADADRDRKLQELEERMLAAESSGSQTMSSHVGRLLTRSDGWKILTPPMDMVAAPWFSADVIDTFLRDLGIPAGQSWIDVLAAKEHAKRDRLRREQPGRSQVLAAADLDAVKGYDSAPAAWSTAPRGPEDYVQLAAMFMVRRLDVLRLSVGIWLDSSKTGISISGAKPDAVMTAGLPLGWPSVVRAAPLLLSHHS
jgi:hypothetical protein